MIELIEDDNGEELSYANLYEGATLNEARGVSTKLSNPHSCSYGTE